MQHTESGEEKLTPKYKLRKLIASTEKMSNTGEQLRVLEEALNNEEYHKILHDRKKTRKLFQNQYQKAIKKAADELKALAQSLYAKHPDITKYPEWSAKIKGLLNSLNLTSKADKERILQISDQINEILKAAKIAKNENVLNHLEVQLLTAIKSRDLLIAELEKTNPDIKKQMEPIIELEAQLYNFVRRRNDIIREQTLLVCRILREIISQPLAMRTIIMERWIAIMQHAYDNGDIHTTITIIGALNNASINRLKATKGGLSEEARERLDSMQKILSRPLDQIKAFVQNENNIPQYISIAGAMDISDEAWVAIVTTRLGNFAKSMETLREQVGSLNLNKNEYPPKELQKDLAALDEILKKIPPDAKVLTDRIEILKSKLKSHKRDQDKVWLENLTQIMTFLEKLEKDYRSWATEKPNSFQGLDELKKLQVKLWKQNAASLIPTSFQQEILSARWSDIDELTIALTEKSRQMEPRGDNKIDPSKVVQDLGKSIVPESKKAESVESENFNIQQFKDREKPILENFQTWAKQQEGESKTAALVVYALLAADNNKIPWRKKFTVFDSLIKNKPLEKDSEEAKFAGELNNARNNKTLNDKDQAEIKNAMKQLREIYKNRIEYEDKIKEKAIKQAVKESHEETKAKAKATGISGISNVDAISPPEQQNVSYEMPGRFQTPLSLPNLQNDLKLLIEPFKKNLRLAGKLKDIVDLFETPLSPYKAKQLGVYANELNSSYNYSFANNELNDSDVRTFARIFKILDQLQLAMTDGLPAELPKPPASKVLPVQAGGQAQPQESVAPEAPSSKEKGAPVEPVAAPVLQQSAAPEQSVVSTDQREVTEPIARVALPEQQSSPAPKQAGTSVNQRAVTEPIAARNPAVKPPAKPATTFAQPQEAAIVVKPPEIFDVKKARKSDDIASDLSARLRRIQERFNTGDPAIPQIGEIQNNQELVDFLVKKENSKIAKEFFAAQEKSKLIMTTGLIAAHKDEFGKRRLAEYYKQGDKSAVNTPTLVRPAHNFDKLSTYVLEDVCFVKDGNDQLVKDSDNHLIAKNFMGMLQRYEYWVDVAYKCLTNPQIQDAHGAMAIITALENINVLRNLDPKTGLLSPDTLFKRAAVLEACGTGSAVRIKMKRFEAENPMAMPYVGTYDGDFTFAADSAQGDGNKQIKQFINLNLNGYPLQRRIDLLNSIEFPGDKVSFDHVTRDVNAADKRKIDFNATASAVFPRVRPEKPKKGIKDYKVLLAKYEKNISRFDSHQRNISVAKTTSDRFHSLVTESKKNLGEIVVTEYPEKPKTAKQAKKEENKLSVSQVAKTPIKEAQYLIVLPPVNDPELEKQLKERFGYAVVVLKEKENELKGKERAEAAIKSYKTSGGNEQIELQNVILIDEYAPLLMNSKTELFDGGKAFIGQPPLNSALAILYHIVNNPALIMNLATIIKKADLPEDQKKPLKDLETSMEWLSKIAALLEKFYPEKYALLTKFTVTDPLNPDKRIEAGTLITQWAALQVVPVASAVNQPAAPKKTLPVDTVPDEPAVRKQPQSLPEKPVPPRKLVPDETVVPRAKPVPIPEPAPVVVEDKTADQLLAMAKESIYKQDPSVIEGILATQKYRDVIAASMPNYKEEIHHCYHKILTNIKETFVQQTLHDTLTKDTDKIQKDINHFSSYIVDEILNQPDLDRRRLIIERYIQIMLMANNNRDYMTVGAIYNALHDKNIIPLVKSFPSEPQESAIIKSKIDTQFENLFNLDKNKKFSAENVVELMKSTRDASMLMLLFNPPSPFLDRVKVHSNNGKTEKELEQWREQTSAALVASETKVEHSDFMKKGQPFSDFINKEEVVHPVPKAVTADHDAYINGMARVTEKLKVLNNTLTFFNSELSKVHRSVKAAAAASAELKRQQ